MRIVSLLSRYLRFVRHLADCWIFVVLLPPQKWSVGGLPLRPLATGVTYGHRGDVAGVVDASGLVAADAAAGLGDE